MTADDLAAAILYNDRARTALLQAKQYKAQAEAVVEQDDVDDIAGDTRRQVYRHLLACADAFEALADGYRERAFSAQQLRRHRYDGIPNTVQGEPGDLARQVAAGAKEHAPGHRIGHQPGPNGQYARWCTMTGCTWRDVIRVAS